LLLGSARWGLAIAGLTLALSGPSQAIPATPPPEFVRVSRDSSQKPVSFQTSISRYATSSGNLTIDLVAVVHFAEHQYYADVNHLLEGYDAVLYEMVGPDDPSDPRALGRSIRRHQILKSHHPEAAPENPLSDIQSSLAHLLGLEFQLDDLNYACKNFVHADITPNELFRSVSQRGESLQQIMVRSFKSSLEEPDENDEDIDELNLVGISMQGPTQHDRIAMRRILSKSFKDLKKMNEVLEGPGGSTLLTVRNKRVSDVLARVLKSPAKKKHVAILYGAAHMPGIEEALTQRFGLALKSRKWLNAWDLRYPST